MESDTSVKPSTSKAARATAGSRFRMPWWMALRLIVIVGLSPVEMFAVMSSAERAAVQVLLALLVMSTLVF